MPSIPPPEYWTEAVSGILTRYMDKNTLVVGLVQLAGTEIASGTIYLRYAIPTLAPPIRDLIPGLMVGERGGAFTGRKAWDYMQERWEHHLRADVVGLFAKDAAPAQLFLKELDFGAEVRVYAYPSAESFTPLARVERLVTGSDAQVPDELREYLKQSSQ